MELTAVFMQIPDGYIAFVEEVPDARVQAATLDEARELLREIVLEVLASRRAAAERSIAGLEFERETLELAGIA